MTSKTYSDVHNKTVLLVSVGQDSTKDSLYSHIASMGVNLVALEAPTNKFAQSLAERGVFKHHLCLDLTNRPTLVQECLDLIDNSGYSFDGILTFWDDAVGLAVRLSEHYKLPGNRIESVDLAHDKRMARVTLQQKGFASPRFNTVNSEDELLQHAHSLTFPVILKPLYGAASIGVIKVENQKELLQKYRQVRNILEDELSTGGLMGLTFESPSGEIEQDVRTFCIEEFLDGAEYDCDIIMYQGDILYARSVDNLPLQPPNFCEIMELTPPSRGPAADDRIQRYGGDVLKALGFQNGVFHVEIIDDRRLGPVLVECNPRMGGGPMRGIHDDVYGVDLAEEAVRIALGVPPALEKIREAGDKQCVTINLHSICSGVLKDDAVKALEFANDDPAAQYWVCPNKKGDKLVGWNDGYPSKTGRIQLTYRGISSKEAIERANDVLNQFNHNLAELTELSSPPPPPDFFTVRHSHFA